MQTERDCVRFDEPRWWYGTDRAIAVRLLAPAGRLWGWVAERRYQSAEVYRSRLPVICIGNFTAGGTGKTPLSIAVAGLVRDLGFSPTFLTRGYGGRTAGPHWVDEGRDGAELVGDEPLLLSRAGPVMVARDRVRGALAIEGALPDVRDSGMRQPGGRVIIMDDGLQNPGLVKDLAIAVVDGRRGIGNGRVLPAGPLRAHLPRQLQRVHAIVINQPAARAGETTSTETACPPALGAFMGPILTARTVPAGNTAWLKGAPVFAYAGIGSPQRFFDLLEAQGAQLVEQRAFPDHHAFSEVEARKLLLFARDRGLGLVTTDKDLVRLSGLSGTRGDLREASRTLSITVELVQADRERLKGLVEAAISSWRAGA